MRDLQYGDCSTGCSTVRPYPVCRVRHLALTVFFYIAIPKVSRSRIGLVNDCRGAGFGLVCGDGRAAAGVGRRHPRGSMSSACRRSSGSTAPTTLNAGRMLISLKPRDDRRLSASDIIRRLQRETAEVPASALHAAGAGPTIDARSAAASTSLPCRTPIPTSSLWFHASWSACSIRISRMSRRATAKRPSAYILIDWRRPAASASRRRPSTTHL